MFGTTTLWKWIRTKLSTERGIIPAPPRSMPDTLTIHPEDSPMEPFVALITPMASGGGGNPPGIWGPPGPWPTPPIHFPPAWGGSTPPGIWGPPGPWPTPPIQLPPGWGSGNPPGIWGPNDPRPTPPIYLPGKPGEPPNLIWGGGNVPMPTPPIYMPPSLPEGGPGSPGNPLPVPPMNLPTQPIAGVVPFYIYIPGQNVMVGPIYSKPGESPAKR